MKAKLRDGTPIEVYDGEGKSIEWLYNTSLGKAVLKILIHPAISHVAGKFLDSSLSKYLVNGFVKKNNLDLSDYPNRKYHSFNDFFTRKITPGKRIISSSSDQLIAPSDGKLSIFPLEQNSTFKIKGSDYTLQTLLRNEELAKKYCGGWGLLFRLSVDDYHRYSYPVSGMKGENIRLKGVYHTVNPRAAQARSIYQENTREYTVIESKEFGSVLMMEVGAMLVGRITNLHGKGHVEKGKEKGYFEFGGSSIMVLIEKDCLEPDIDIVNNSKDNIETVVKLGEKIGIRKNASK